MTNANKCTHTQAISASHAFECFGRDVRTNGEPKPKPIASPILFVGVPSVPKMDDCNCDCDCELDLRDRDGTLRCADCQGQSEAVFKVNAPRWNAVAVAAVARVRKKVTKTIDTAIIRMVCEGNPGRAPNPNGQLICGSFCCGLV